MLLVADNVINTYNYSNLLTAICKHAPVFVVKVPRPYFSKSLQGVHEKFGLGTRLHPILQVTIVLPNVQVTTLSFMYVYMKDRVSSASAPPFIVHALLKQ